MKAKAGATSLVLAIAILSVSASAAEVQLEELLRCKYSWNEIKNGDNSELIRKIGKFIESNFVRHTGDEHFSPLNNMTVFGFAVASFSPSFGMNPGFMTGIEAPFNTVVVSMKGNYGIAFDDCDSRSCGVKMSETETFGVVAESNITYVGCSYPYVQ